MTLAIPLLVLGVGGAVAYAFFSYWQKMVGVIARLIEPYRTGLEKAAIPAKSEELALAVLAFATIPWGIVMFLLRPNFVVGAATLVITSCLAFFGVRAWINVRIGKRLTEFNNQLEMALRLIAGAMRVGLGLRQALVNVVTDMPDPARVEFTRVLSQTQIGVSLYDALDALADRMPSGEMFMMARAIRLQGQTGGNLSRVLENMAGTIKERRRLAQKIRALTAEARTTKWIITGLPVFVAAFVTTFEPDIREGLFYTMIGRGCVVIVIGLLALGWWIFNKISQLDI
ncbi:MAG TPA: type II secretion system F family protein [Candidatus Baltobacteraceae bacterium]|jgi:tight adherence protein B|nr:type II secretion system F family protein [Candidatus Baltobacteraceae bacterium]